MAHFLLDAQPISPTLPNIMMLQLFEIVKRKMLELLSGSHLKDEPMLIVIKLPTSGLEWNFLDTTPDVQFAATNLFKSDVEIGQLMITIMDAGQSAEASLIKNDRNRISTTLIEIFDRRHQIMAILREYAKLPEKKFQKTELGKNRDYSKLTYEWDELAKLEKMLTGRITPYLERQGVVNELRR